jgi:hypothetical protein
MNKEQLLENYRDLNEKFKNLFEKEKKRLLILSLLRLLVFLCGTGLSVAGFSTGTFWGIMAVAITVVLFLMLVSLFSSHSYKRDFFSNHTTINNNEINALCGNYSFFNDGSRWIDKDHEFSNDVDLFGKESLFQYLNRTVTGYGRDVLAGWLSDPYKISKEIGPRQEAIKELSVKLSWRQAFIASVFNKPLEKEDIKGLLEWLDEKDLSFSSASRKLAIFMLPGLAILSLVLMITGYLPYSVFIFFFLFNLLFTAIGLRKTGRIHSMVSKKFIFLSSFNQLIAYIKKESFSSAVLSDIKQKLSAGPVSAAVKIKKLSRILQSFDSRLNILVGFVLNGLLLWDFHCIRSLEEWKEESAHLLPEWLDLIGQTEAYISLANFSFNNQGYIYPHLNEDGTVLNAKEIGHPLISEEKRICNEFSIRNRGQIFIITGANMAGKSTFLRTLAVNFILGMSGAPVCAKEMSFRPLKLYTSMRTTDSLGQNESYFYAELKRLRNLKNRLESGEDVFFILDEILKGTNSTDKSTGSKMFMKKIIDLDGTGVIATHDTSLGEMEDEFPVVIYNKCFEIEIDGDTIIFDYKLREGITKRMNAALLLKQMGIA